MTPKEKAAELVDKLMKYEPVKLSDYTRIEYPSAINLAKICVDEILSLNSFLKPQIDWSNNSEYWQDVKQELNEI